MTTNKTEKPDWRPFAAPDEVLKLRRHKSAPVLPITETSPIHILPDLLVEPLAELVEAFAGFGGDGVDELLDKRLNPINLRL